jgi:hypothetical protein
LKTTHERKPPSSIVMPWYQVVRRGNGGVVDGEKRAALRDKVGDHGFAAAPRIGALAASPERRRSGPLALGTVPPKVPA